MILYIDWIFFLIFIAKTLIPIEFTFSILRMSLIFTGNFMSSNSSLFVESLWAFIIFAGLSSYGCNYLTENDLKHSVLSIFWLLIRPIEDANEYDEADHYGINNNKIKTSKSFECKTKIVGSTPADNYTLNKQVVIPIKYFWVIFGDFFICLWLTAKYSLICHVRKIA